MLRARLQSLAKHASMWGSPGELEAVALAFFHAQGVARTPLLSFPESKMAWGGPFAGDELEHQKMREKLYGSDEALALGQVMAGFAPIFAALALNKIRGPLVHSILEQALEEPQIHGHAEQVHAVIFSLLGFAAEDAADYVQQLKAQRLDIGGHELRPFFVLGPSGASAESLGYQRQFTTFARVQKRIAEVACEAPL
jgi:hypothetical protein